MLDLLSLRYREGNCEPNRSLEILEGYTPVLLKNLEQTTDDNLFKFSAHETLSRFR